MFEHNHTALLIDRAGLIYRELLWSLDVQILEPSHELTTPQGTNPRPFCKPSDS